MLALFLVSGLRAQAPGNDPAVIEERARRSEELRKIEREIELSDETRQRLEAEAREIQADRERLRTALIDATRRSQEAEEKAAALEGRLRVAGDAEAAIRRSLESRRGLVVEVLAALQRMGLRPPPAVLVRPDDLLSALRTAMLLGAVLPDLRAETQALAADLQEFARLRTAIAADRTALRSEFETLALERQRLDTLIAARQNRLGEAERGIGAEAARAAELGTQARTLKELIDRMEREIDAARQAEKAAREAEDAQARALKERFSAAAARDPARLTPRMPFAEAQGTLARPVTGAILRQFGGPDGSGGTTQGISIGARPGARVSAPTDGWIAFAGPFRSFGRLLIINAGGGYYILLAGMDRIDVEPGQFVLAGEPLATMGEHSSAATGMGEVSGPILYVEFRKDGGSIDPGPWWAKTQGEKVRG